MKEHISALLNILHYIVIYFLPIASFVLSLFVFIKSRKINRLEEKLKQYELDKIEQEQNVELKAFVEARIVKLSSNNYRIKVWNSGTATAYDVDYDIPSEYRIILHKQSSYFNHYTYLEKSPFFLIIECS